jgi:hypothetical protein
MVERVSEFVEPDEDDMITAIREAESTEMLNYLLDKHLDQIRQVDLTHKNPLTIHCSSEKVSILCNRWPECFDIGVFRNRGHLTKGHKLIFSKLDKKTKDLLIQDPYVDKSLFTKK